MDYEKRLELLRAVVAELCRTANASHAPGAQGTRGRADLLATIRQAKLILERERPLIPTAV